MPREFRSKDSYETELIRRDLVMPFLQQRGFRFSDDHREKRGTSISQRLIGQDDRGENVSLWVRLCWRKEDAAGGDAHSAAQLISNVDGNRWVEALEGRIARAAKTGATHLLLLQNAGSRIEMLASIPLPAVLPIWKKQRDASRQRIDSGGMLRRKNHAENGRSPALWLRDVEAPTVAAALWNHPGVRNLAELPVSIGTDISTALVPAITDVYDDLAELGRDGAKPQLRVVAGYPRDRKVREEVMRLSGYKCERPGCTSIRDYVGALDSHHILGIKQSDRVTNCVALCPNCHRDAHFHPEQKALNAILLQVAQNRKSR